MKFEIYLPENGLTESGIALSNMLKELDLGVSYADMMRLRVSGGVSNECCDRYYVAHENGICYSRLWNGWGNHNFAIGNFGNFFTSEQIRGQGIGKRMLEIWYKDLTECSHKPLGIFCTSGERAAKLYFPYGFRTIKENAEYGPLFLPIGDSPSNFRDFCEKYYEPSDTLICRPATIEWRHEIDCLLKFAFFDIGLQFEIGKIPNLEYALLYYPNKAKVIFTESGKCVGWMIDNEVRLYPAYNFKNLI